jgi:type I restriction enzyme S subunit
MSWPKVALGEVVTQDKNYIGQLEDRLYKRLSVKLNGRGVVLDNPSEGASVRMAKHQLAKPGQIIVSEIWAKKGAIGMVPDEGDGALVTSHFYLFDITPERLHPDWMRWLLRGNYFEKQLAGEARGTTGYASVRPKHFLAATAPLPPLDEQRRIVARLDRAAAAVERTSILIKEISDDLLQAARNIIWRAGRNEQNWVPCGAFLRQRSLDTRVDAETEYVFAGVYSFGRGIFRSGVKSGSTFSYPALTRIRTDDFFYPKLMAWEGALGVVPPDCDGLVVSPEFPVFKVDSGVVRPAVLDTFFRDPRTLPMLRSASSGTNMRRRRIQPGRFLELKMPIPSADDQAMILALLERRKAVVEARRDSVSALEALIPAMLDRAFGTDAGGWTKGNDRGEAEP